MRKIYFLLLTVMLAALSNAQNVTVNPGAGSYPDLTTAFAAINAGTHTGAIAVSIINNTTEPAAGAILNASGSGAASYTSISISPGGGAARTISGAATAGLPLIDFNGADNVTIDGLNSGGNSLIIENTTVSATSGTSTIRFIGGATTNTITRCTLRGAGTMSVATNGATIFFSTDASTANGNDNNTISNNDIGPVGANLPTKAILGNGSTTTTAIGNSGNIITNNDIHDYFGAAVTSSGVATNGGCNTWTITNNRFYQAATRTWTTGATHRAIDINNSTATSGAQGFTVTGNIIGYATNTQTGIYSLTGSTGKFQAIQFSGISAGTVSNINNNTIASVSMTGVTSSGTSTSSPFAGVLVINGLTNTNSNTIGSQSATGSLTFSTNTTTATDVYGMFNFSLDNWVSNNNNIGGISVTNAGASGTFLTYGLRANTSTTLTWSASSNTIGGSVANSIQLNATGVSSQVVGMQTPNAISTFTLNTIRNLTSNIGTGTTTAASVAGIIFTSTTPNQTVSQNTIFNLINTNATAASVVTGIQFTGGTANIVQRNLIYDLIVASNSATAEVNGIRVAGGTTTYRNNMIRLGAGITNAIGGVASNSSTTGINGFNGFLGTDNFWHNSIYIEGSPTSGTGASYAFNGTQTVNTRSFRDNIFFNARSNSGATGSHYAVKINGTAPNPTGLTINNNVYFANGTGAVFGFFNSLNVANIAAWRTAVGQDAGSFESNPQYNAPAAATPDLHIHPTNLTVAEGNGADVGVVDDYDGQTRASFTPVDIGADAGNFAGLDLSAPNITYTPLGNTSLTTNRTIAVTITDVTGVATGAVAPRIYFNKNAGAYFSTAATLSSGTVQNGVWTCTIDNALIGGVVTTDVIRYFVVAQDVLGNLAANPGGGFTGTDVNTVTTPPTTPNSYTIVAAFSGIIPVGTGETYTSLTNTGGIFEAINAGSLTGNVTINITSDLITELGTVSLNQWSEDGVGGYTMLIKPSGAPRTITGTNTGGLIKFNGADKVTVDGSTTGATAGACLIGGNAAIRELTIQNTNIGTSACVISVQSGTNGAQNNTIRNVNVLGQDPTTTLIGISLGGNTPGTVGTDNDNNRVENCSVRRALFGIYSAGLILANQNTGTVITQNDLSALTTDRIRRVGILVFNDNGVQITENSLGGIETNESADAVGIGIGTQGIDATNTTAGGVSNALVSNNRINGVASLSAVGFSAAGITVAGANNGSNTIQNNMITGVTAPSTSPDLLAGVYVVGAAGSSTRLYHNTVSMTGDRGVVASQMPGYGIAITGTDPTVDLRNNIIYTSQIASGGGVNARSFAVGMVTTTFANLTSNYNDYWSTGANDGGFRTGSLGAAAGTDYATLALYAAATGKDANSQETDPIFVSATDLHLSNASGVNWCLNAAGTTIASVTTDIDCQTRGVAPFGRDLGADEFTPTGFVINNPAAVCSPATVNITLAAVTAGSIGGLTFTYFTDADGLIVLGTPGAVAVSGTYYIKASNGTCSLILPVVVTINAQPNLFTVTGGGSYCSGGTGVAVGLNGSESGVNYQLQLNSVNTGSPVAGTGAAISFGLQTGAGTYTVVATNTTTLCTNTMTGSVNVSINPLPTLFTVTGGGGYCSGGSGSTVGLSGSQSGVNYQLQLNSINTGAPVAGTGAAISFGLQTGVGTYTVIATNTTTLCTTAMTGSVNVSINPLPASFTVTGGGSYCSGGAGVAVGLSGSQSGVNYQLQLNSVNTGAPVGGTGAAISFGNQTGAGTYTVVATNATTLCTNNMTGSVVVSINPLPTISGSLTEPGTCVSADGAINITLGGAAGPYTFSWSTVGGSGVVAGAEDQTGLTAGQYTVVVTAANSCQQTAVFNLIGPGGCSVCPVIGSLVSNPTPTTCVNSAVNLNASGLTFMGITYGIQFKYSNTALANPYVGGTTIATVANGSLTGGGTAAATSTSFAASGNYYIYAILSPVPIDPSCRPSAVTFLQVNPTTTITSVTATPNPVCIGSTTQLNSTVNNNPPGYALAPFVNYGAQANAGPVGDDFVSGVINIGFPFTYFGTTYTQFGIATNGNIQLGAGPYFANFSNQSIPNAPTPNNYIGLDWDDWIANAGNITYATVGVAPNRQLIVSYSGMNHFSGAATGTLNGQIVLYETSNLIDIVNVSITSTTSGTQGVEDAAGTTGLAVAGRNAENFSSTNTTWRFSTGSSFMYSWTANPIAAQAGISNPAISNPVATVNVDAIYSLMVADAATGCSSSSSVSVTTNPIPTVNAVPNQTVCNSASASVNFSGAVAGTVYNWTNNNTAIGLGASGSGNISFTATNPGTAPITGTITVTPSYTNGGTTCLGTPVMFTITVNPTPIITPVGNQTVCNGASIPPVNFTVSTTGGINMISWTNSNPAIGIPASGTGNIFGFTGTNATNAPISGTITVTPSYTNGGTTCTGSAITYTVTVNPTATVNVVANQTVCNGASTAAVNFSSPTTGGTIVYNWTNNTTSIGLAASGTGNIASFVATNTGTAPVTATITVTPTYTNGVSCVGTPRTFTITVNPTPIITPVGNQTVCNGASIPPVNFTVSTTGGINMISWTNSNPAIGIPASGTGNIFGFTGTNATNAPISGTITVTPSYTNGGTTCTGPSITYTVTVNPTATVNVVANQTVCNGASTAAVNFSSPTTGGTIVYNWTNNTTSIGLAASGTGNIASFVATNTGTAPVTATITVTPTYTNGVSCVGTQRTFTITVNPTPTAVATPPAQTICSGATITPIVLTGAVSGTTYNWTRNNTATVTGIAASGSGNITGILTNTTAGAITVTFTITPTANGCPGTPITATVLVNTAPTIVCPASITVPSIVGGCTAVVNYTPTVTGAPAPTLSYTFTGATTGSGSGSGSGSTFNVGVTTVTITATNACGSPPCSFTVTVTDSQLPVITSQPVNRTVCAGANATFSVVSTNVVGYQWQQWNGSAWVNISGATASSFTVSNTTVAMNTNTFRVVITGLCTVVNSNAATLYVNPVPTVVISATPPPSLLPNQTTTLNAFTNPSGGTFTWFFNGTTIPGVTGSSLGPIGINQLGTYRVVYTDPNGCIGTSANLDVTGTVSNQIWVYPNPNFGQFQVRFFNQANEQATINVFNAAGQNVYQRSLTTGGTPYTQIDIDLGLKANGVYIVQIVNGSGKLLAAKQIIVQNR